MAVASPWALVTVVWPVRLPTSADQVTAAPAMATLLGSLMVAVTSTVPPSVPTEEALLANTTLRAFCRLIAVDP